MGDTLIIVGSGILINLVMVAFSYGGLTARVKNIEKMLNNGFTCKKHADLEKEIGRLQGKSER